MGNRWGSVGSGMAVLCGIHCAALPLLAGASSLAHEADGAIGWEAGMLGFTALIGFATLGTSYRAHRRMQPLFLLCLGLGLMVAAHFGLSGAASTTATLLGVISVVSAQAVNRRLTGICCRPGEICAGRA